MNNNVNNNNMNNNNVNNNNMNNNNVNNNNMNNNIIKHDNSQSNHVGNVMMMMTVMMYSQRFTVIWNHCCHKPFSFSLRYTIDTHHTP